MTELATKKICATKNIANKFGGVSKFSRIIGKHRTSVHRWIRDFDKGGNGGHIPPYMIPKILKLAKEYGIELDSKDFYKVD